MTSGGAGSGPADWWHGHAGATGLADGTVLGGVAEDIAVATRRIAETANLSGELRQAVASAERAFVESETESRRTLLAGPSRQHASDPSETTQPPSVSLTFAVGTVEVLRQRCSRTADLAGEVYETLQSAGALAASAGARLNTLHAPGGDPSLDQSNHAPELRAAVLELQWLVGLTAPMAKEVQTRMQNAAATAARLIDPNVQDRSIEYAALLERGVRDAGRHVTRSEQSAMHLDGTAPYAEASARRTLRHADDAAEGARRQRRETELKGVGSLDVGHPTSPTR